MEEDEEQAEGDTREEMMVEGSRVETGRDIDDPELRKNKSLQQPGWHDRSPQTDPSSWVEPLKEEPGG